MFGEPEKQHLNHVLLELSEEVRSTYAQRIAAFDLTVAAVESRLSTARAQIEKHRFLRSTYRSALSQMLKQELPERIEIALRHRSCIDADQGLFPADPSSFYA